MEFSVVKDAASVLRLAKDGASCWLAVLARDGEILVHKRTGILQERWALEENCLAAIGEAEEAARKGRITWRLPPFEAGRDGLESRPWAIWMGLPTEEKLRLMRIESEARDAAKPHFPGWENFALPADLYESSQWEYDGHIELAIIAFAKKTFRDVPEEVPNSVLASAKAEFGRRGSADVASWNAAQKFAASIPKVDVGDFD